jgi:hypothetical protein
MKLINSIMTKCRRILCANTMRLWSGKSTKKVKNSFQMLRLTRLLWCWIKLDMSSNLKDNSLEMKRLESSLRVRLKKRLSQKLLTERAKAHFILKLKMMITNLRKTKNSSSTKTKSQSNIKILTRNSLMKI